MLKTVEDRGAIRLGYRENSPPFAFLNRRKPDKVELFFVIDKFLNNFLTNLSSNFNKL
jgi:hypothetical protein